MPFNFTDSFNNIVSTFSSKNKLFGNPIVLSVVLSMFICIIVVLTLKDDYITSGKTKLFKIFIYSCLVTMFSFVVYNDCSISPNPNNFSDVLLKKGGAMVEGAQEYVKFNPSNGYIHPQSINITGSYDAPTECLYSNLTS